MLLSLPKLISIACQDVIETKPKPTPWQEFVLGKGTKDLLKNWSKKPSVKTKERQPPNRPAHEAPMEKPSPKSVREWRNSSGELPQESPRGTPKSSKGMVKNSSKFGTEPPDVLLTESLESLKAVELSPKFFQFILEKAPHLRVLITGKLSEKLFPKVCLLATLQN